MSDIKINRINRNFKTKVHLYFNKDSYSRLSDTTPRFYLAPVELLNLEKVAFTPESKKAGYSKYGNRFWKWKGEDTLNDAQAEYIFAQMGGSYPYGYIQGDTASQNKYYYDLTTNDAAQSFYKSYWDKNQDKVVQPKTITVGNLDYPYPYIEFITNEIVTFKHIDGTIPDLPEGINTYAEFSPDGNFYDQPPSWSCDGEEMEIKVSPFGKTFEINSFGKYLLKLGATGRYRFDLNSGTIGDQWPTGIDGGYSGYRFRFSTGEEGVLNGYEDYESGISYVRGPEVGYFYLQTEQKTSEHPDYGVGSVSGFAISGSGGDPSGTDVTGVGHFEHFHEGGTLSLRKESLYYFFQNDGSNSGHEIYISTGASGQHSDIYESGVNYTLNHEAGVSGNFMSFRVPHSAPDRLYYQCQHHTYMGGQINVIDSPAASGSGSAPGESIIFDVNKDKEMFLHYYSPDKSGIGGYAMIKTGCAHDDKYIG
ncbi:hypothetical protein CL634_03830 [bacterium]|nr:hypothetical protein [bacterium]